MKKLFLFLFTLILLVSCKEQAKIVDELPSDSIFNLTSNWQNQNGETLKLANLRGKTMVVVMIYTTCKTACPVLVADMKKIEQEIAPQNLKEVSLVLVSIDPEHDTPEVLKEFAEVRKMTEPHWVFLRSDEQATQEFANVLSMKYKKISPVDFSHSNIITIFNPNGELIQQEEGLVIHSKKIATKVNELVAQNK
ncbi:MAG: SCO family protein [Crocinitomicaceae bacterium]|nr:SCO family protein [Crocinitomicaceae bacterium]